MCGFVGAYSAREKLEVVALQAGLKNIAHRGPDFSGTYVKNNIFLGHNRLSIIDLDERGNQPLFNKTKDHAIIFNGEIYNYESLRTKLNTPFLTNTDTEVILQGYLVEGVSFFSKLRGIYAFAIVNLVTNEIVLARDPSGVKPLYYYQDKENLLFASEIKGILGSLRGTVKPNIKVIEAYLNLGYCPEPETAFIGIVALRPGHYLKYTSGVGHEKSFLAFSFSTNSKHSYNYNKQLLKRLIKRAVKRNLVADVDCSIALSGGIDSSLLYALSQSEVSVNGLTVCFKGGKGYDESETAKGYANYLNGPHQLLSIDQEINLDQLNYLLDHFDQPFADTSFVPVFYLTKAARSVGKVIIGGDGGDELFNGYPSMIWMNSLYNNPLFRYGVNAGVFLRKLFPKSINRKFERLSGIVNKSVEEALYFRNSWLPANLSFEGKPVFIKNTDKGLQYYVSLFGNEVEKGTISDKITMDYFRKTMLSDYLRKTDMMSMLNSVELRVPMLDEDLVSKALSIPFKQKGSLKRTKAFLRDIHSDIYKGYGTDLPKSGFSIPLNQYLSKSEKSKIIEEVIRKDSPAMEYISKEYVNFLGNHFIASTNDSQVSQGAIYQRIILLYALNRWYAKNW